MNKKQIRAKFRNDCFTRDKYSCKICGVRFSLITAEDNLDAHHITPRENIINGGYVKENGITLCKNKCHLLAEKYLSHENFDIKYSPENLYALINSSLEIALISASKISVV